MAKRVKKDNGKLCEMIKKFRHQGPNDRTSGVRPTLLTSHRFSPSGSAFTQGHPRLLPLRFNPPGGTILINTACGKEYGTRSFYSGKQPAA